ncbi:hypothetical protein ABL78_5057 [Leptomonas seymouri]|uniref:Uncharacterized protein n=1 Tax=Leptomonas seymouri TaxID=5684 RepID=A0A0N0P4Z7_LEPSE|nr:hypothetical protein ABL78_5057 [Leptomonas seymouri]|eukprot:KPI85876.1 hypothetical protein ABL78_5057 [Leptomonas seymouri]
MLPTLAFAHFRQRPSCQVAPLSLQQTDSFAACPHICQPPQPLKEARHRLLAWLPSTTRQALLDELRSVPEERASHAAAVVPSQRRNASKPMKKVAALLLQGSDGAQGKGVTTPCGSRAPSTALAEQNSTTVDGHTNTEAALAFLAFLLYPATEYQSMSADPGEANVAPAQHSVLLQLELACALLLRCMSQNDQTEIVMQAAGAPGGAADASLCATVRAQAVHASLQMWTQYFLCFFLNQLSCERTCLSTLRATAAHPRRTPPSIQAHAKKRGRGNVDSKAMGAVSTKQQGAEAKSLQQPPLLSGGFPLHFYAQKLRETANTIFRDVERTRIQGGELVFDGSLSKKSSLPEPRECFRSPQRRKQPTTTRGARRQSCTPGKRAASGYGGERQQRARRESSSDSTSSSSMSSPTSECIVKAAAGATPKVKSNAQSFCTKLSASDGDTPLAVVASLVRRAT